MWRLILILPLVALRAHADGLCANSTGGVLTGASIESIESLVKDYPVAHSLKESFSNNLHYRLRRSYYRTVDPVTDIDETLRRVEGITTIMKNEGSSSQKIAQEQLRAIQEADHLIASGGNERDWLEYRKKIVDRCFELLATHPDAKDSLFPRTKTKP